MVFKFSTHLLRMEANITLKVSTFLRGFFLCHNKGFWSVTLLVVNSFYLFPMSEIRLRFCLIRWFTMKLYMLYN